MARKMRRDNAKRSDRPNPREDRNQPYNDRYNQRGTREESYRPNKKVEILPRNEKQEDYIAALHDDYIDIVFAMGPAGTGKTLLATLYAIKCLQEKSIKKVIITRPLVNTGDNGVGFLPGSLIEKLSPWCIPILDVFKEVYTIEQVEKMLEDEVLELAPLSMQRGRTLKDCVVIVDEAQNTTVEQMKMMLTRIGDGCKMIVTGDARQHDRGTMENGLVDFVNRIRGNCPEAIDIIEFDRKDVERHPVVGTVLGVYGED